MRPLPKLEMRNLNREIEERLHGLRPLQNLVVVRSTKGRKCYGVGLNVKGDLILRNFLRWTSIHFKPYGIAPPSETVLNTAGVSKLITSMTALETCCEYTPKGTSGSKLAFGDPATTPTPARDDYSLESLVAWITPSVVQKDEVNWRTIVTGSYVWVAGGTVRETGMAIHVRDTSIDALAMLIYHDAVSDVTVPADGTVSVTYTTQL